MALELLGMDGNGALKSGSLLQLVVAGAGCAGAFMDLVASLRSGFVLCSHHRVHDSSSSGPGCRRKYKVKGVKRGTWNGIIMAGKMGGAPAGLWV